MSAQARAGGMRPAVMRAAKAIATQATAPIGSVVAVRTSRHQVVLTYDDGPDVHGTSAVLNALGERGATATFFVLLTRVRRHPETLREVLAAGHEVGLHGVDHRALTRVPAAAIGIVLRDAKAELEDATGRPVRWLRPPYGAQSAVTWWATRRAGLTPVMWGPTLADSRHVSDNERVAILNRKLASGAIILGHDAYAGLSDGADDGPEPQVDRGVLAKRMLAALDERGLAGVSLEQALKTGARLHRRAWFG